MRRSRGESLPSTPNTTETKKENSTIAGKWLIFIIEERFCDLVNKKSKCVAYSPYATCCGRSPITNEKPQMIHQVGLRYACYLRISPSRSHRTRRASAFQEK